MYQKKPTMNEFEIQPPKTPRLPSKHTGFYLSSRTCFEYSSINNSIQTILFRSSSKIDKSN